MFKSAPKQTHAIFLGLFVAFLWSTSWVLIKFGLQDIPPLTFAGLRYGLATLCLLPFLLKPEIRTSISHLSRRDWLGLVLLGVVWYAAAQGAQFIGLKLLPAMTVSLFLNMTPLLVSILGIWALRELPGALQWIGMVINLCGVGLYFFPAALQHAPLAGILAVLAGVAANALSTLLNRGINRGNRLPVIVVTTVSMGIGSVMLLVSGIIVQGMPAIPLKGWGIILWLAVINTALAFNIWNYTLRTLTAMESSLINSTMLVQVALLAWLILGEDLSRQQWAGIALAAVGVVLVQLKFKRNPKAQ
ncbi:MAG: EamA family transporter [Anaerolineaceae bacterium]|nr:EamA family transporter [Anaerolineaceae bacterium]